MMNLALGALVVFVIAIPTLYVGTYLFRFLKHLIEVYFPKNEVVVEPLVVNFKTTYPDVRFTCNQQSAFILLHVRKDFQAFNSFSSILSPDEKREVLNHISLNEIN